MLIIIYKYKAMFAMAFLQTIILFLSSAIFSFTLGNCMAFLRCNKTAPWLRNIFDCITFIFRGIPIYIQLLIFYFVLPEAININLSPTVTAILCMGLCSASYISQIMRGAINSISPGQWLAAYSLGYSKLKTIYYIIWPQALRISLSAIIGELDQLIKTTSLVSAIGIVEVTRAAINIVSREMNPIPTYSAVAVFYLCISAVLWYIATKVENNNKC